MQVNYEIHCERVPYLSALVVFSRRGAIQIHVYLYLYLYLYLSVTNCHTCLTSSPSVTEA